MAGLEAVPAPHLALQELGIRICLRCFCDGDLQCKRPTRRSEGFPSLLACCWLAMKAGAVCGLINQTGPTDMMSKGNAKEKELSAACDLTRALQLATHLTCLCLLILSHTARIRQQTRQCSYLSGRHGTGCESWVQQHGSICRFPYRILQAALISFIWSFTRAAGSMSFTRA